MYATPQARLQGQIESLKSEVDAANGLKKDLLLSQGKVSVVLPIGPEDDSDNLKKVSGWRG